MRRDCLPSSPRTQQGSAHQYPPHPGSPSRVSRPRTPCVSISQTTSSMSPIPPFSSKVDRLHLQDTVAPSLHARYRRFITTASHSAPEDRLGIRTRGITHSPLSLDIDRQVPMFHSKARTEVMPPQACPNVDDSNMRNCLRELRKRCCQGC